MKDTKIWDTYVYVEILYLVSWFFCYLASIMF